MVGFQYFDYNKQQNRIDSLLASLISKGIKQVKKDDDFVIFIFGAEGTGKSELRNLIGAYCQSQTGIKFGVPNIWFNIEDYMTFALNQKPLTVISHDEARRELNTKRSMSKSNVKFTDYFSECRDNNQIHIVILPAFSDLEKYLALWRAKMIIEVGKYKNKETGEYERGMFRVIKTKNKKKLAELHKMKYSRVPKSLILFKGHFDKCLGFDYDAYKKKKQEAKIDKYLGNMSKEVTAVIPSDILPVIANLKPSVLWEIDSSEYNRGRKWLYSLRKQINRQTG